MACSGPSVHARGDDRFWSQAGSFPDFPPTAQGLQARATCRATTFGFTPDGKGFVVTRDVPDEANRAVITVVTNWFEEFRK